MRIGFFKKIPIAIASFFASSTAFAATNPDSRMSQLEAQMEQVHTETAMGTCGAQTASARPIVVDRCESNDRNSAKGRRCSDQKTVACKMLDCSGHYFLTLAPLYFCTNVGGTEYAYSDRDPRVRFPVHGRVKDMNFEWDWGLRAGVGYNFAHDGWDAHLQYTWFDSNGSDSTRAGLNSSIVPLKGLSTIIQAPFNPVSLMGDPVMGNPYNFQTKNAERFQQATLISEQQFTFCLCAKSEYDFNYQSLDLELGRAFFISSKLSFRPHLGLKSAWIDQEQITRYTGGALDEGVTYRFGGGVPFPVGPYRKGLGLATVHIRDSCHFWGLGPRTGMESKWHLGCGFSLFGNIAGALLYGLFDVDHKEQWTEVQNNRVCLHDKHHAFSPMIQYQLGLRYDRYIRCEEQHIGIGLGFEGQYFWRQNQMFNVTDGTSLKYDAYAEDVSLHGLILDVRFDF